ncbi:hypothetical protein ETB97_006556 [Aspergillus alliaceus]|uniref:Uncharacterized protein n=1 Tax=Petromyces alliaceus TaxID=209559 RepID=A0A5N6FJ34_PETAA|nr:uncharacterized protein BDW43DRAFT_315190 [Aspergillus alliaceus]KAB8229205.1 hypothetical protein BDW43DRAFT_315190 [Aspergillus alliaceus]KAE8386535.1 hypothetical protein BDV23DRAFT_175334 [Aspergillus alliaceus]KAF5864711.1 hypothetical protein ETB97_006556 [Aspergillus burnettii]
MGEHEPVVSHGRGGQGNIGADSTQYVDGGIVREGPYGDQGDGAYSAGRGGAGNIGSPHVRPATGTPHDAEIIPELAIRGSTDGDYHTGRGGQGNVHLDEAHKKREEEKKHQKALAHDGLADKLKYKLFGKR